MNEQPREHPEPAAKARQIVEILERGETTSSPEEAQEIRRKMDEQLRDELLAMEDARRLARFERRLRTCGIPEHGGLREAACTAGPRSSEAIQRVVAAMRWRRLRYEEQRKRLGDKASPWPLFLYLSGDPGNGKSTAMAWLLLNAIDEGLFVLSTEIAATVVGHSSTDDYWRRLFSVDLLCIDELGMESGDPAKMIELLLRRFNAGKATIGAGNVGEEAVRGRYGILSGSRLYSRLEDEQARVAGGLPWFVGLAPINLRAAQADR